MLSKGKYEIVALGTPKTEQTRASTRLVINAQYIKDKCKLNLYHITVTIKVLT